MVRRRSKPRAVLQGAILACLVVALACCVGLFYGARLAEKRWERVVAHLDSRLPEVESRLLEAEFPIDADWSLLHAEVEAGPPMVAKGSTGVPFRTTARIFFRPHPTTISTPHAHSTPLDRAWWRGLLRSSRERSYHLELGTGYEETVFTIRQERQWLATDFRIDNRSKTPLDGPRAAALAEAVAEVGLQLQLHE